MFDIILGVLLMIFFLMGGSIAKLIGADTPEDAAWRKRMGK